ncbi:MAG TPA: DNA recombination protein RmuC [Bacteroidales bacterium]|nr:DNA recombination protein RmuC [Bacteroidales bacterium]
MEPIALITLLLVVVVILLLIFRTGKTDSGKMLQLESKLDTLDKMLQRVENQIAENLRMNREELSRSLNDFSRNFNENLRDINANQLNQLRLMQEQQSQALQLLARTNEEKLGQLTEKTELGAKENREELNRNFDRIGETLRIQMGEMSAKQQEQATAVERRLEVMQQRLDEKLSLLAEQLSRNAQEGRDSMARVLKDFQDQFTANVKDFNELQRQKFDNLERKQGELIQSTELKLEKMRETVDEKLQKTLETRLGQSFELVSKQLESVQKGLGEMQTLAQDVGGLKRVLSNVKTKGIVGEYQLSAILEQILAPEQYEANVKTKRSSSDHVEFAIRLPGRENNDQPVYLPIDAKFPLEDFNRLQTAYEEANPQKVEESGKALINSIRKFASDISSKYLDPPFTTDFAIMFLPIEGLYAEVVRNPSLMSELQGKYRVIVTGPTTLAAILNSLQMGFKTLAIQQRSSEVWKILGQVKTEFEQFGEILEKAKKKIEGAGDDIEKLVGTRTRAIQRKLRNVEALPVPEAGLLPAEELTDDE